MKRSRLPLFAVTLTALLSSLILHPSAFGQGALTPPGPPAPTFKTLQEIEPRTPITNLPYAISASGSYYVTTNMTGISGINGISIFASDLTIDLGGFTLVGGAGSFDGIAVVSGINIVIRNGTIRDWGMHAVAIPVAGGAQVQVQQIRAIGNGSGGLSLASGAIVSDCFISANGGTGINGGTNSLVKDCLVLGNTSGGGISVLTGSAVMDCVAQDNKGSGITAGIGSTVNHCVASGNSGDGVNVSPRSTVSGCTSVGNAGNGIEVTGGDCLLLANNCTSNRTASATAAGILATASGNRIEGNHVNANNLGIKLNSAGNLVIKNSATGNITNYVFTGTQTFGPTNNLVGAGGVITNENPWANFSY